MSRAEVEVTLVQDRFSSTILMDEDAPQHSRAFPKDRLTPAAIPQVESGPRRTPRKSLIVVLPENHVMSPDLVAVRLPSGRIDEEMDVILVCTGQSTSSDALQRQVQGLRVLQAPAGTSTEDLREFGMRQAPGDIVTLLCGTPLLA